MSTTAPQAAPTSVTPALMTAAEFFQKHGSDRVELVKGQALEIPMPFPKQGKICWQMAYFMGDHVVKHDAGHMMTNDSFVQTKSNPDTVRGADISFYSYERLPKGKVPDGLLSVVPDLIVEVRSPSERWGALFTKVGEYLQAGVRVVIILDEPSASASVYRAEELQQIFHNGDALVVPDVLPGFSVPVQRLFE